MKKSSFPFAVRRSAPRRFCVFGAENALCPRAPAGRLLHIRMQQNARYLLFTQKCDILLNWEANRQP